MNLSVRNAAAFALYVAGSVVIGTPSAWASPIFINSVTDLQNIRNNLSGDYVLGSNIDATGFNFTPIGESTYFTGVFDGLGHTISNLNINTSLPYVGLFGTVWNGTIKNVGLINTSITGTGSSAVGGLVGISYGAITNVYATGAVSSTATATVGGLVGAGFVSNSYFTGQVSSTGGGWVGGLAGNGGASNSHATATVTVTGQYRGSFGEVEYNAVGGLVGLNWGGLVDKSYATGAVSSAGVSSVGGLVGLNAIGITNLIGSISNSYATGAVSVSNDGSTNTPYNSYAGGLVGEGPSSISSSYATGAVSGSGLSIVGGLVGGPRGTITNGYWDIQTTGQTTSSGGTGLTTAQLQSGSLPGGFDPSVWTAAPGQYPKLQWQANSPPPRSVTLSPGVLPPLPPFVFTAPPLNLPPPPNQLMSSTPQIIQGFNYVPPAVSAWISEKLNNLEISIGQNNVFYPDWLKKNAPSIADGIDTATHRAGFITTAISAIQAFSKGVVAGLKQFGLDTTTLGILENLKTSCPNGSSCARLSIDSAAAADALVTFATSASKVNGVLAGVSANIMIYRDFLSPALKQYGKDPTGNDYTNVFVPTLQFSVSIAQSGNQALDDAIAQLLQSTYRAALYLTAANRSFDRYTAAYNAGDANSALLQYEAMLYYLDLYTNEAVANATLDKGLKQSLADAGFGGGTFDPAWLSLLQQDLLQNGFSADELALFENLNFSPFDINDVRNFILGLNDLSFSSGADGNPFGPLADQILLTAGVQSSVPEGNSLLLFGIGFLALVSARRRLRIVRDSLINKLGTA